MKRYPKCTTLYPGYYIFVCPCGFLATLMRVTRKGSKFGVRCWKCEQEKGRYYKVEYNRELDFGTNWNNKLNCCVFTTIRLYNPIKYCVGNRFDVRLKGQHKGYAILLEVKKIYLDQINEFTARIDTGYSAEECRKMIETMYKNRRVDWKSQPLAFCLLQYDKQENEPKLNFENE